MFKSTENVTQYEGLGFSPPVLQGKRKVQRGSIGYFMLHVTALVMFCHHYKCLRIVQSMT